VKLERKNRGMVWDGESGIEDMGKARHDYNNLCLPKSRSHKQDGCCVRAVMTQQQW
jgi:hypothetical protein